MFLSFEFEEFAPWLILPLQTVWWIFNLKRNSEIQNIFAFRNQSGWLTRIERSFNTVSPYSFFYALHTDHIEEKVSHCFGLLIVLILEAIVEFFITVTVGLGVEIKVKHSVFASERFDFNWTVIVSPAATIQLSVNTKTGEVRCDIIDSTPQCSCTGEAGYCKTEGEGGRWPGRIPLVRLKMLTLPSTAAPSSTAWLADCPAVFGAGDGRLLQTSMVAIISENFTSITWEQNMKTRVSGENIQPTGIESEKWLRSWILSVVSPASASINLHWLICWPERQARI